MSATDERLRAEFAVLRAAERANAASFDALVRRPPRRRRRWRLVLAAAVGAAALALLVLRLPRRPRPVPLAELSGWQAPSDALLALTSGGVGALSLGASALDAFLPPPPEPGVPR